MKPARALLPAGGFDRLRIALWPAAALAGVVAIAAGDGSATIVSRAAAFALALASLVVLTGWSGQLNLHVAAIGLGWGAYAAAGLAANGVPSLLAIVLAPVVVAPAALVVGAVAVRFRGLELAIATLAAGLAFEQTLFQNLGKWLAPATSGTQFENSLIELARPAVLQSDKAFALFALAVAAVWLALAAALGRGRAGRTLRAVRDRELVAEARGVPTFAWRVGAFVASTAIAAAGGAVFGAQTGSVTPDSFGFALSLQLLAVATVAGIRRIEGALLGAAILVLAQESGGIALLKWLSGDRADLFFGAGLIAVLAIRSRRRARTQAPAAAGDQHHDARELRPLRRDAARFAPTILRIDGVCVSFGARTVLDRVHLRVGEGEVCGLVGGNGAGKTTLFNCVTGLVTPSEGRVYFAGRDITEIPPHRRAALGLARTFQGVEVFEGLTVEEGLLVSANLRGGAHGERALRERARSAVAEVGIAELAGADPAGLPFATLRLVEIATALVANPSLVLLDEPLAGLDAGERARVLATILALREQGRSVLIVEHDLEAVAQVADRVYELNAGVLTERPVAPVKRPEPRRAAPKEAAVAARA